MCLGQEATIVGTDGHDILEGATGTMPVSTRVQEPKSSPVALMTTT
jgi:hypothetical protein